MNDDDARPTSSIAGPILVTGATGNLGREVVAGLLARGARVRCLSRRPSAQRPGVDAVVGDLTDGSAVRAALAGAHAVFVVWPLLDVAPAADLVTELGRAAPRVVYLSSAAIDDAATRQSDRIVQVHADMERMLQDAGLGPIVLRSETLASNTRGWAAQVAAGNVVSGPDIAPTAVVDERDVAAAAVSVLLKGADGVGRGPHLLTGPEQLRRPDQVAVLGAALGRRLRFEAAPPELARTRMLADGLPEPLVEALVEASVNRPQSALMTDHVERLTGRSPGSFARWVADHLDEFR